MMKTLFIFIPFLTINMSYAQFKCELLGKLPGKLQESSGLVFENENSLWTLNDGGNGSYLYNIDSTGEVVRKVEIKDHKNYDWESLHLSDNGYLYIGDFGNNANKRKHLKILRIKFSKLIGGESFKVKEIEFSYEDQDEFPPKDKNKIYDCEAMVVVEDSIYLITKNRTKPFDGQIHIYSMPATPGKYKARHHSVYDSGINSMYYGWITDADLHNGHLYLLSHNKFFKIPNFGKNPLVKRKLKTFRLSSYSQKEAIAFGHNRTFYLTDEKFGILGPKLYKVTLP